MVAGDHDRDGAPEAGNRPARGRLRTSWDECLQIADFVAVIIEAR
jgi:hypothetical protein